MIQKIRKIIFKILLGKDNYTYITMKFKNAADKYMKDYKEWKPMFEGDLNFNRYGYDCAVGILKKLGVEYGNK